MIQNFVDKIRDSEEALKQGLRDRPPGRDATDLFTRVIEKLAEDSDSVYSWEIPDPDRITVIDHGDYQGTLVFVVGAQGYQPSSYWAVTWGYGSCGGCDTLEAIADSCETVDWEAEGYPSTLSEEGVDDYFRVMMHMVEGLVDIG